MAQQESGDQQKRESAHKKAIGRRLDSVGWGLFFIWVGVAVLLDVGWGVGLLGVGILALVEQGIRKYMGLAIEGFWVVVGILLVVGGGWELVESRLWLVAVVLILAGVAMLVSAARGEGASDSP